MCVLTLTDVIPLDCNDWFSMAYIYPVVMMFGYTIASIACGSSLIKIMGNNGDDLSDGIDGDDK